MEYKELTESDRSIFRLVALNNPEIMSSIDMSIDDKNWVSRFKLMSIFDNDINAIDAFFKKKWI